MARTQHKLHNLKVVEKLTRLVHRAEERGQPFLNCLLGDSTVGAYVYAPDGRRAWRMHANDFHSLRILNASARSSQSINDAFWRLKELVRNTNFRPHTVVLFVGTPEIILHMPVHSILHKLLFGLDDAIKLLPDTHFVVLGLLPELFDTNKIQRARAHEVNAGLTGLFGVWGSDRVDIFPGLGQCMDPVFDFEYMNGGRARLNVNGYSRLADCLVHAFHGVNLREYFAYFDSACFTGLQPQWWPDAPVNNDDDEEAYPAYPQVSLVEVAEQLAPEEAPVSAASASCT